MIQLVFCAKDENLYIKDFFDWHYNLGFEAMHCADNGGNGDKLDGINYYDYVNASAFQIPFYQRITDWLDVGDWAFFCDVDEFLTLDVGSIDKFVSLVPNDVDCVLFNWKCFGDCGLDDYEDRPVWQRFTEPATMNCVYNDRLPTGVTENCHVKALVRKSYKQIIWNNVHCPLIANGKYVNANLEQVNPSPWQKINWKGGYLSHYITKDAESFAKRRLGKIDACGNKIDDDKLIRWYFNLNGYNKKTEDYFKEYLNAVQ